MAITKLNVILCKTRVIYMNGSASLPFVMCPLVPSGAPCHPLPSPPPSALFLAMPMVLQEVWRQRGRPSGPSLMALLTVKRKLTVRPKIVYAYVNRFARNLRLCIQHNYGSISNIGTFLFQHSLWEHSAFPKGTFSVPKSCPQNGNV